jgi:hypothetical protein
MKAAEPVVELAEEEIEEEDDAPSAKNWTHEGADYYKGCDNDCDIEQCDCTGVVYDIVSQDPIGTWDGTSILPLAEEED